MSTSSLLVRSVAALFLMVLWFGVGQPVSARPEYLARFQADPLRRAEVDGCSTCHVASTGGGARNEFGAAFDAAGREITPLLRTNFPKHFAFPTVTLADGAVLSFADPLSKAVVVTRKDQKFVADLATLTAVKEAPLPPPANRMSFFVTSRSPEHGGKLGGLAGADRLCQNLAKAAGAGDRTWRAYLSTSFKEQPAVNAGDRIGAGPWYNAKGLQVARGFADLHTRKGLDPALLLTERGEVAANVKILTGTRPDGTAAVGQNCSNWTSDKDERAVAADPSASWNSGAEVACQATGAGDGASAAAAAVRLYCFAEK